MPLYRHHIPLHRVVMFGYIGWEIYRRISSWFDKGSKDHQELMALDQDRQLLPRWQDGSRSLQPLAEPDPRTVSPLPPFLPPPLALSLVESLALVLLGHLNQHSS
jgi:hypothetical protein